MSVRDPSYPVTVYYDGGCRFCSAEIQNLMIRNTEGRLSFVDCSPADFDSGPAPRAALMNAIHGVDAQGRLFVGVDTFRVAYRAVGLGWVTALLSAPALNRLAERGYPWLVRNRYRIPQWLVTPVFEWASRRAANAAARNARACQDGACTTHREAS